MTQNLEQQFVKLLDENQNIIHKVCRVYTNNSDAHKDLFQEITIQLWKAYPKFRGDSKFSTWMYRVGLNTAITLYRKSKRQVQTSDISDFHYKLESNDYDGEVEEQMQLLYKAIHQLTDIEKALILLYLEDKPYKEIADLMGITEVNARVKVNRIKTKLKTILNP
ncbi:MAG: RNA polymerase sigma factor [Urechidicola sp.]|nr:RNA polymerase sigma factor [Urechidicola sp.]